MKNYDKKNAVYSRGNEEFVFDFHTSISAGDKARFVNSVTYLLVGDNYNIILKDIIFDLYIVKIFTNVDVSWILKSKTLADDAEKFLRETNVVEIVKANAKDGVIEELENALALNIEYKTGIHRNIISESIVSLIDAVEKKVNGFTIDADSLMGMMNILNEISGELTMDKMLDAYAKSDMYKSQHEEVVQGNKKREKLINDIVNNNFEPPVLSPNYEV